jgi:hypothetical protein
LSQHHRIPGFHVLSATDNLKNVVRSRRHFAQTQSIRLRVLRALQNFCGHNTVKALILAKDVIHFEPPLSEILSRFLRASREY